MVLYAILFLTVINFFTNLITIIKIKNMAQDQAQALQDLQAAVANDATVEQSAITLLGGLKTQLDAAIASSATDDGVALEALSTQLGTQSSALAAAITANTPAAKS